jgi:hypothetical protein
MLIHDAMVGNISQLNFLPVTPCGDCMASVSTAQDMTSSGTFTSSPALRWKGRPKIVSVLFKCLRLKQGLQ